MSGYKKSAKYPDESYYYSLWEVDICLPLFPILYWLYSQIRYFSGKIKKIKILNKCILDKKHNINKLVFIIDLYMTSEGNS